MDQSDMLSFLNAFVTWPKGAPLLYNETFKLLRVFDVQCKID